MYTEFYASYATECAIYNCHSKVSFQQQHGSVLIDFSLTVKAATLIFKPGRGSVISSAMVFIFETHRFN